MTEFSKVIDTSPIYLSQLAAEQDGRVPSAELCVLIEKASDRLVMRWDLRPNDWHRIWPELIGIEGAPELPQSPAPIAQPATENVAHGA